MGRKKLYEDDEERLEAERARKRAWYQRNRVEQQEKMRRYYDKKVGGDRLRTPDKPRAQISTPIIDEGAIRRHIRRIRLQDGYITGSAGPSLTRYAKDLLARYKKLGREDGQLLFVDFVAEYTAIIAGIEADLDRIKEEGSILHNSWKEGAATRDKFVRMLGYVEDMLGWAEQQKLRNAEKGVDLRHSLAMGKKKALIRGQTLLFTPAAPKTLSGCMKSFLVQYGVGYVRIQKYPRLVPNGLRGFRKTLFVAFDIEFRLARLLDEEERAFKQRLRRRHLKVVWPGLLWVVEMFRYRPTGHGLWRPIDIRDIEEPDPNRPRPVPKPQGKGRKDEKKGIKKEVKKEEIASVLLADSPRKRRHSPSPLPSRRLHVKQEMKAVKIASASKRRPSLTPSPSPSRHPRVKRETKTVKITPIILGRPSLSLSSCPPRVKQETPLSLPSSYSRSPSLEISSSPAPSEPSSPISFPSSPMRPQPMYGGTFDYSRIRPEDLSMRYAEHLMRDPRRREEDQMVGEIMRGFWR